ncbi:hypothetical protein [Bacillus mycoides]|uniref:hypothetical protein n=1 Tax=Bacillus mycoides TaxID=1405 RepID=UPI00339C7243
MEKHEKNQKEVTEKSLIFCDSVSKATQYQNVVVPIGIAWELITYFQPIEWFLNTVVAMTQLKVKNTFLTQATAFTTAYVANF